MPELIEIMNKKTIDAFLSFQKGFGQNLAAFVMTFDPDAHVVGFAAADLAVRGIVPEILRKAGAEHPALVDLLKLANELEALPEVTIHSADAAGGVIRRAQREAALVKWDSEDYLEWRQDCAVPDEAGEALLRTAEGAERLSTKAYDALKMARSILRNAQYTVWSIYEAHHAQLCVDETIRLARLVGREMVPKMEKPEHRYMTLAKERLTKIVEVSS